MKIKLKRVARLGDLHLNIGEHEIDAKHADHWYFKALQKDKDLEVLESAPKEPKKAPKVEIQKVIVPESPIDFSQEEIVDDSGEDSEEPKKSKRKK